MKNVFVVLMNVLFLAVVAADVVAVKFECASSPVVQKSCYQERQAQYRPVVQTAELMNVNSYKL